MALIDTTKNEKSPSEGASEQPSGLSLSGANHSSQELSMFDLNYHSQAEEIHDLLADPAFQALMNEPDESEMANWYEITGAAA